MPARIDFDNKDIIYISKAYQKGASLDQLAAEYEVSIPVIRRILSEANVNIRGRGRPKVS